MKHLLYIFLATLLPLVTTQAQRMIPKQKGFEISTGILSTDKIGNDYYITIMMTVNGRNGNYQLWGLEYGRQFHQYKNIQIPQETYSVEGGYSFFLLGDAQKNVTFNFALTGIVGYETINRNDAILYDGAKILNESNIIYGVGGRLSLETYLSDRLILVLQSRTKAFWGTELQQFRPSVGVGLRFNF